MSVYFAHAHVPSDALEIDVVGKQWMGKFQHMDGQREINEPHVPVNRNIKLTMTTEDVIHSFFVPAFRTKADVVPGRDNHTWFKATKPGQYHLFCAEYCGTNHSVMGGWEYVMEPADDETWLSGGRAEGSLASAGEKLFQYLACNSCHRRDTQGRGPVLNGLFGKTVLLNNGQEVIADESYLRESILYPRAKIVAGFQPIMPTFKGVINEEQLLQLIAPPDAATGLPPAGETQGRARRRAPGVQRSNPEDATPRGNPTSPQQGIKNHD